MRMKKALSLVATLALGASMVAGGSISAFAEEEEVSSAAVEEDLDEYSATSEEIYTTQLGDFYDAYMTALEAENVSDRFALMAVAEAKLLESAVMLPLTSNGGMYGISRVAPYSSTPVLWGNDSYRYHQRLVTTEPLKSEDRAEMKAKYAEVKGTGTYDEWSKSFLEEKGYTLKSDYVIGYSSDPQTWDVFATSRVADSEAIVNTYDGLMEYDNENMLQPALAESYEVSEDGLTYTFKIREGAVWVDSQGRKVADVTADDFVAGMQHMMDAMGGLEYLVQDIIVNASAYIYGEITDFNEVGVKAVDEYTLEYTLNAPCSYFMTMLGYGVFAPMNRSYYVSQGGKFGLDFDASADDYTYGKDPNSIAYCGPYVVTNSTAENTIVFKANESYWNKDNINLQSITWLYNDGSDATKAYNDMTAGVIDGCSLNASALELAKADGSFDQYGYVTSNDATSFMAFLNVNREAFANTNDTTTVVSEQTEEEAARTKAALQNVHFRRALTASLDRGAYNAQVSGEDLKYTSMRNSYTPGTFVTVEDAVTVDINGTPTEFAAGTYYGEIMQAQIDADGVQITVWDPNAEEGLGSGDGFDGWYNPEAAKEELAAAAAELAEAGVTVDAENPIYIDYPYPANIQTYTNRANTLKQSIESALDGAVVINLVNCTDAKEWYYAGYYTDYGYEANYDIYDVSGWGPDYGDPQTYLDTFLPDFSGYMIKCIGIY